MSTGERKFLHDMASPLTIAQGMLDAALEIAKRSEPGGSSLITKLEKSSKALERMADMLRARRAEIIASEGQAPPSP